MTESVLVEQRAGVQIITINRPQAKNALDAAVARGITDAIDELEASDTLHVGVLTGAGGTFSAGMDLKAFLRGETPMIEGRGMCGITWTPPRKPLIAAVEGWALAGGFELLLACDLVIAGESAKFGVPEVKRALVAGGGAAHLLPKRLPRAIALEMLLTGEPIPATRAAEVHLINRVVADGTSLAVAVEMAEQIASNGPLAVTTTKQIAISAADWSFAESWKAQDPLLEPVFASEDAREGASAFAERRPAVWRGR